MNKQQLEQELAKVTNEYNESLKLAITNNTESNYIYSSNLLKRKQELERQLRRLS